MIGDTVNFSAAEREFPLLTFKEAGNILVMPYPHEKDARGKSDARRERRAKEPEQDRRRGKA